MKKHNVTRREGISLVSDIAQGLAYLHEMIVTHSDLKSDNVLISQDRRGLLTDFGISRMESITKGYTMTKGIRGSTRWQAPEYLPLNDLEGGSPTSLTFSSPPHTKETDVWAFGMTVYEILTKDRPYKEVKDDMQVVVYLMFKKYPPKPAFSDIPGEALIEDYMWSICARCRETDPSLRPSMNDLKDEMEVKVTEIGVGAL